MKMIKLNLKIWVLLAVAVLSLSSCNDDDDYVINTVFHQTRATVTSLEGEQLTLSTDFGDKLTIVSDYSGYAPSQGQRTFILFSVDTGSDNVYDASLHTANDILTKDVIALTAENEYEIANDPIHLYNVWCAGGYLNVNFGFNMSGNITHYVNLVENTLVENPQDGKIYLEFRHNAMGDTENYGRKGTVCYKLQPYQNGENIVTFVIKFTEFDGSITTREIKYDFVNDDALNNDTEQIYSEYFK